MFSKQAIEQYLNRDLEDYNWIKEGVYLDLLESIKSICPMFNPKLPLFTHQLAGVYLGLCLDQFLFFLDMGLGKTILALTLIQCKIDLNQIENALVVVPNLVNIDNWIQEIEMFTNLVAVGLGGTKAQREAALKKPAHIYIINYDGLKVLMTELKAVRSRKTTTQKRKRKIDDYASRSFAQRFDLLVLDECHHAKNSSSLNFQLCAILSEQIHFRFGMTGTPIGRNAAGFWGQFYIIDHGETLGEHEEMFQQALFKQRTTKAGFIEIYLPKKHEVLLKNMMANRSIRYADYECGDVPKMTIIKVSFSLSDEVKRYGKQLILDALANSNTNDRAKKENIYSKTRQLCSGFVYESIQSEDSLKAERVVVRFPNNQKLAEVESIITDIPDDSKIVICHFFKESGRQLVDLLTKLKIKFVIIGELSPDNVAAYRQFRNDPTVKGLVLNMASGGEGLNLQVANYAIIYEPIDHADTDRQVIKRIARTGQLKHCFIYRFITKKSVEERIMEFIQEGKELFQSLLEGNVNYDSLLG